MTLDSVRKLFIDQPIVALATTSADGTPNVAPMFWKLWHDDSTLLVLDNYMNQTKANIQATSKACVSAWNAETGDAYKIKGRAQYVTDGIYMERGSEFMASQRPGEQPQGTIVIYVEEIYSQKPGTDAGTLLERLSK
jgi:predicted pyridoxine 5'-phosphate oxidase superfamily flavin-nucleotide-binding protein